MTTVLTLDEIRAAMRDFGKASADNIERAIRALEDGGAAADIVGARPIKTGSYLGFVGTGGTRIAWLHVGHLDLIDAYAPDNAFPSGIYAGISRVAFPGYSESTSPNRESSPPLPCQECFNALPWCECE